MTDDTETTSDDMTDNDETTNPLDLLPVGDTDVFAETAEHDDDTDHGFDVAEEVEAMHIETSADDGASDDESPSDDDVTEAAERRESGVPRDGTGGHCCAGYSCDPRDAARCAAGRLSAHHPVALRERGNGLAAWKRVCERVL